MNHVISKAIEASREREENGHRFANWRECSGFREALAAAVEELTYMQRVLLHKYGTDGEWVRENIRDTPGDALARIAAILAGEKPQ